VFPPLVPGDYKTIMPACKGS